MAHGDDIIRVARTYLGTPYHHQGRLKGVGVDCIGLIVCVAREFGIDGDMAGYDQRPAEGLLTSGLSAHLAPILPSEALSGDVLCFWIGRPELVIHAGFKTDYGLLHTYGDAGKVCEHSMAPIWQRRLAAAFRFPG